MLEVLSVYHRWLRGVVALLAITVFLLSLMSTKSSLMVNITIFIVSQAAILVITKIYAVKAQFSGITNVLFADRNIFTSPYFIHMACEVILWNIQTPPIVAFWAPFMNLLNYFIFLRLYAVILYLNNAAFVYRTFCRVMAAMSDIPLSTIFFIQTGLIYRPGRVVVGTALFAWFTVGLLFARAELLPITDGLWFSFQALSMLGYGDITPVTLAGRAVAVIAWLGSYFLVAYLIASLHRLLTASATSHNRQTLATCHDLTCAMRHRSARVIQMTWRLHRAQRRAAQEPKWTLKLRALIIAALLTHFIAALRRTRQRLAAAQRNFAEMDLHPITGLSSYQFNTYLHETHQAARQLQRVKDVDRVLMALRDRDVAASSLSRKDIEAMLLLPGDSAEVSDGGFDAASSSSSFVMTDTAPASAAMATSMSLNMTMANWQKKVEVLEQKCNTLSELLDIIGSSAQTMPPSMAQSQM